MAEQDVQIDLRQIVKDYAKTLAAKRQLLTITHLDFRNVTLKAGEPEWDVPNRAFKIEERTSPRGRITFQNSVDHSPMQLNIIAGEDISERMKVVITKGLCKDINKTVSVQLDETFQTEFRTHVDIDLGRQETESTIPFGVQFQTCFQDVASGAGVQVVMKAKIKDLHATFSFPVIPSGQVMIEFRDSKEGPMFKPIEIQNCLQAAVGKEGMFSKNIEGKYYWLVEGYIELHQRYDHGVTWNST